MAPRSAGPTALGHPTHFVSLASGSPNLPDNLLRATFECPTTIHDVPELDLIVHTYSILVRRRKYHPGLFLDVGAHCGFWTVLLSSTFASVVAVEPGEYQYELLERNCVRNTASNVSCIRAAASDAVGAADLHVMGMSGGSNTLEAAEDQPLRLERVRTITVDSLELRGVALIKIDVEGHELNVLSGARETILSQKPHIVIESNNSMAMVAEWLHSHGYATDLAYVGYPHMLLAIPGA